MKILICTEAGNIFGMGHLTRCQALFKFFETQNSFVKILVNTDKKSDFSKIPIDISEIDWLNDINFFSNTANYDVIIIDSYIAPREFYLKISKLDLIKIYIDDNNRINYPEGIILNWQVYASKLQYNKTGNQTFLLGPEYTVLRQPFWDIRTKNIEDKVKKIAITLGGSDIRSLTTKLVEFFKEKYPHYDLVVVLGSSTQISKSSVLWDKKKIQIEKGVDAKKMLNIFLWADIVISGCGQTLYELMSLGVPFIGIGIIENQIQNINALQDKKILNYAGFWSDAYLFDNLSHQITRMEDYERRKYISEREQEILNHQGVKEIYHEIKKLWIKKFGKKELKLRKATQSDMRLYFDWANDESVRLNSFKSEKISLKTHFDWFLTNMKNNNTILLVAEIEKTPIGQIRLKMLQNNGYLNYSIDKAFRNKGYGTQIIQKTIQYLRENKIILNLYAEVKQDNIGSIRIFEKCNFKKQEQQEKIVFHYKF